MNNLDFYGLRDLGMLLFKKKFLDLIRQGQKTQTVRIWPRRQMRVGQRSYIPGAGYITVEAVDEVLLEQLTDDDAARDGFPCADALRQEIARLYPEGLGTSRQAFRIAFRLLEPHEQLQAVAEREARKAGRRAATSSG